MRWVLLSVMVAACAAAETDPGSDPGGPGGKGDYYGTDDRQQIRDAADPRVKTWARSIAMITAASKFHSLGDGRLGATTRPLRDVERLCSDERFADEPALGFCSAWLIGPDLVATAGHCFDDYVCEDVQFVFDYYPGGAAHDPQSIPASSVFGCREVVARQYERGRFDYALVRLDRPTTGRTPFTLQPTPPAVGARIAMLGFPSGIWAKVDLAGTLLRDDGHRFRSSLDSFPGHSGGVVIDLDTGGAFAVHIEGSTPSFVNDGTCSRTNACDAVTPDGDRCQGATHTSVSTFGGRRDDPPPPPPPPQGTCEGRCGATDAPCACDLACSDRGDCCGDFSTTCAIASDTLPCLDSGAPCDASNTCANAMCTCEGDSMVTESFVVPGQCATNACANTRELCSRACEAKGLAPSTWIPTCQAD